MSVRRSPPAVYYAARVVYIYYIYIYVIYMHVYISQAVYYAAPGVALGLLACAAASRPLLDAISSYAGMLEGIARCKLSN
jgi:hypothetical protein